MYALRRTVDAATEPVTWAEAKRHMRELLVDADNDTDSGWRFMVDDETEDYLNDTANLSHVSIGAVLREDNSFIHLLDHEADIAFVRNGAGEFAKLD